MENNKKLVIFESLSYSSIPAVYLYAKRQYKICYFALNAKTQNIKLAKKILDDCGASALKWEDYDEYYRSHDLALDNIEQIYDLHFGDNKVIHKMESLFDTDIVHNVYKKALVEKLLIFYQIFTRLNYAAENTNSYIIFIPSEYCKLAKLTNATLNSKIHIPFYSRACTQINEYAKKLIYIAALILLPLLVILWKTRKIVLNTTDSNEYQVGLRVYNNDWGFLKKYRTIDFLIDGNKLNKDNTIFCVETAISKEYMLQLKEKGYNVVEIPKILHEIDLSFIKNTLIKKIIPYSFKSSYLALSNPSYISETTLGVIFKYILWSRFTQKYALKHFVAYNHFEKYHIVRNILLSTGGVETWYYLHSSHYNDLFKKPQEKISMREVEFSYLYYNNLVSWGDKSSATHDLLPNLIKEHQKLGCLWSEHVRIASDGNILPNLRDIAFHEIQVKPTKIIGVFDTTFGDMVSVILRSNDIVLFIGGILKMLEQCPHVGVIFKEKWVWEEILSKGSEISIIYDKLRSHERCYSTGGHADTCEVIAASDLVISACFTSTTSEALGAGKKAIYFDATSRFRDCYYDKFPKMVAHGFDELEDVVKYWLYEVNDAQFNEYLDNYIKGELDSYADGKAITRFRDMLSEENT